MDYEIMMNGNAKIGSIAPEFEANTTMGNISLNQYRGKWLILFSHPRRLYPCIYTFQTSINIEKSGFLNSENLKIFDFFN